MDIIVVLNTMLVLFGILMLGYIVNKLGILDEATNKKISELIVKVTSPALVIASVCGDSVMGSKKDVIFILILGILLYCVLPIFARIVVKCFKVEEENFGIYQMLLIFANTGFIGFPILKSIYGDGAVFYASILNIPFNVLIFSYGVYLLTKGSEEKAKFDIKKLVNPGIVSAVLALIIYLLDIKVPATIADILGTVGDSTIPLSMMVIGSSLALVPLKEVFKISKIYPLALVKLIVMPIIIYVLLSLFLDNQFIIGIISVTVGLPSGSMTVMLSNQYNRNTQSASIGVFITTLFSIVTIPLIINILPI
ncbi:AEC family transporter [Romboutsia weinsteinii]|uniref:AEC family transporter n=1 Tax=Romboutsia weinsteinii TaxID=2020949 RepID=A0A371J9I0_9FIRM|nr:AEC family transporter [Romboutsia weinsteinii]RDY29336.1 AEC family transporter [Romboutsia weinsteinii]